MNMQFYKNKKVLVTGHTGFKGTWLCKMLLMAGAEVTGFSLESPTEPSLFKILNLDEQMHSVIGDIRDFEALSRLFDEVQPEIVLHLAAQPIVRLSYDEPRMTYETNVMGTVNICECVRLHPCVKSFLNVTTDKVYLNDEREVAFKESDPLDGFDPYSNSKSCSELVTHSYVNSFFANKDLGVSTARAGNVIGGGDFAKDRIVPDCVRAVISGEPIKIRNPYSTRPYQHVLEPLTMYLDIAEAQYEDRSKAGYYNVGTDECDCVTTGELVECFAKYYGDGFSSEIDYSNKGPHEANFLKLDTALVKEVFGWAPTWHIEKAIEKTVEWTKEWIKDDSVENMNRVIEEQIREFIN